MKKCYVLAVIAMCGWMVEKAQSDWTQFRGPNGNAVSAETGLPQNWSYAQGMVWRTVLPGLGASSPIVIGDQVLVTCYSGYAESSDSPGDMKLLVRHIVCLDRSTGEKRWSVPVPADQPESKYEGGNNTWHGYSSSTPTSDGRNVYVFFGRSGVFCLSLSGELVWQASVGRDVTGWGSGASPVLFENLLIVNASVESRSLVALDKSDGQVKWKAENIKGCWNTPTRVSLPDGKTELVLSLPQKVVAFDPGTGEQLWYCRGIPDDGYVCPSAISNNGIVYLIGGRKNTALAIRCGGRGDVSDSHVLWTADVGSNVSSPVYVDGRLYWVHEGQATLNCLDAQTGAVLFQNRIEPRPGVMYASLVAADGKLYGASQHQGVYVFSAKPKFELLARNVFADDDSRTNASLAVDRGRIYLRNDKYLYCLGK